MIYRLTCAAVGFMCVFGAVPPASAQQGEPPACAKPIMDKITDIVSDIDWNSRPESEFNKYSQLFGQAMQASPDDMCPALEDLLDYAKSLKQ